jgi:membrane-associated HD superfamily phosphohydrolase
VGEIIVADVSGAAIRALVEPDSKELERLITKA